MEDKIRERIDGLRSVFQQEINKALDLEAAERLRIRFLGKKGEITSLMREMSQFPSELRPLFGKLLNEFKSAAEQMLENQKLLLKEKDVSSRREKERLDITLPGRPFHLGGKHPITIVSEEIEEIFSCMGFQILQGPEVELDYYNFEALNMPKEHPARDMQDSFYINPEVLLRTHTSPMQIRTMEKMAPNLPVRIICPGKVYRRDDDVTHSPMFHQVEGLVVDKGITLADLKGILLLFAREMFGQDREVRLRPSYFPFTEPSAEVDISCIICGGSGCRICANTGWLEVIGSGMLHPRLLEITGYDPEEVSGYALGIGIERIAMLKYGIEDIRLLYQNDLRMLQR